MQGADSSEASSVADSDLKLHCAGCGMIFMLVLGWHQTRRSSRNETSNRLAGLAVGVEPALVLSLASKEQGCAER